MARRGRLRHDSSVFGEEWPEALAWVVVAAGPVYVLRLVWRRSLWVTACMSFMPFECHKAFELSYGRQLAWEATSLRDHHGGMDDVAGSAGRRCWHLICN